MTTNRLHPTPIASAHASALSYPAGGSPVRNQVHQSRTNAIGYSSRCVSVYLKFSATVPSVCEIRSTLPPAPPPLFRKIPSSAIGSVVKKPPWPELIMPPAHWIVSVVPIVGPVNAVSVAAAVSLLRGAVVIAEPAVDAVVKRDSRASRPVIVAWAAPLPTRSSFTIDASRPTVRVRRWSTDVFAEALVTT